MAAAELFACRCCISQTFFALPCVLRASAAAHAEAASPMWAAAGLLPPPDPARCAAASTGLAASALGGTTLNAFAGVGRAEGSVEQLARMASRPSALQRWRRAKTLIVDEVSPTRLGQ